MQSNTNTIATLDDFIGYYFPKDGSLSPSIPSYKSARLQQIGLAFIAMIGATPFGVTGNRYAADNYNNSLGWRIYYTITGFIMGAGLFYNATLTFIDYKRRERIPSELKSWLISPMTADEQRKKDITLGVCSLISAIPISLLALEYPIEGVSYEVSVTLFFFVMIASVVLHFLPIELAFQNPKYRIPFYPIELYYYHRKDAELSPAERQQKLIDEKNAAIYAEHLKNPIIGSLSQAKTALTMAIKIDYRAFTYKINLPQQLQKNQFTKQTSIQALKHLIAFGKEVKTSSRDAFTYQALDFLGSFWGIGADAGYLVGTNLACISLTNSIVGGILLAALPTYFYGVLVSFYGSYTLVSCWAYLTEWLQDDVKIAAQLRLNPPLAIAFLMLSVAVAATAWGTSVQLIQDNITINHVLAETLIAICISNGVFVTLCILIDSFSTLRRDSILYGHQQDDAQWITQLSAQIDGFLANLPLADDKKLLDNLKVFDEVNLEELGLAKDAIYQCESNLDSKAESLLENGNDNAVKNPLTNNGGVSVFLPYEPPKIMGDASFAHNQL